jgi:hypothetical protein
VTGLTVEALKQATTAERAAKRKVVGLFRANVFLTPASRSSEVLSAL